MRDEPGLPDGPSSGSARPAGGGPVPDLKETRTLNSRATYENTRLRRSLDAGEHQRPAILACPIPP
jgi:hypothetical protein